MSEDIIVKIQINSEYHAEIFDAIKDLLPRYRAQHLRYLLSVALKHEKLDMLKPAQPLNDEVIATPSTTTTTSSTTSQSINPVKRKSPYANKKIDFNKYANGS